MLRLLTNGALTVLATKGFVARLDFIVQSHIGQVDAY